MINTPDPGDPENKQEEILTQIFGKDKAQEIIKSVDPDDYSWVGSY